MTRNTDTYPVLYRLTPWMRDVAALVAQGLADAEIAERMGCSEPEVGFTVACFRGRFADYVPYDAPREELATFLRVAEDIRAVRP